MIKKLLKDEKISPEDLLKSILESAFYGLAVFQSLRDKNGNIKDFRCTTANEVAARFWKKSTGAIEGKPLSKILGTRINNTILDQGKTTVEKGKMKVFELGYPSKNSKNWYGYSTAKLGDGFLLTFQDITDKREKSREAATRGRKYRQLFEESIDAIFIADENYDFLEANHSLESLFGFSIKELKCMSLGDIFFSKNDYNLFRKGLMDQGKLEEFDVSLKHKNKREKSCLVNCVSIKDDLKNRKIYLGVIRDMTKRKQADRDLLIAEKLSMTGKIARTIAHEIRNPLTNLTLALHQLKDEISPNIEDSQLYFNIIQRNADRIGKLIADLLNSSKAKELKLEEKDLNKIARESIELVKDRLKLQKIKLIEKYDKSIPAIPLDSDQLKVALLNLLINAVEAMNPNEGILTVRTSMEESEIKLYIKDNGRGISKENLKNLFEPFFTAKKEGAGLGLTAVQNIIHSHKGQIEVKSTPGKGTSFIIAFKYSVE